MNMLRTIEIGCSQNTIGMPYGFMACTFITQATLAYFLRDSATLDQLSLDSFAHSQKKLSEEFINCIKAGINEHERYCKQPPQSPYEKNGIMDYKDMRFARDFYPSLKEVDNPIELPVKKSELLHLLINNQFQYNREDDHHNSFTVHAEYMPANTEFNIAIETGFGRATKISSYKKSAQDPQFSLCHIEAANVFEGINKYGMILGADKHVVAVIRSGNNYYLFNSKPRNFFECGARIYCFFADPRYPTSAALELFRFLHNQLYSCLAPSQKVHVYSFVCPMLD